MKGNLELARIALTHADTIYRIADAMDVCESEMESIQGKLSKHLEAVSS